MTNIIDLANQYQSLSGQKKWAEALPIIHKIVELDPGIATNWFNLGVCLSALGKNIQASEAFKKAYRLDPRDDQAQYRLFLSLYKAQAMNEFYRLMISELEKNVSNIDIFLQYFPDVFTKEPFISLKNSVLATAKQNQRF